MSKNKERITGKLYEDLIYKIYKELEPHADIKKNDMIWGIESGIKREIDISIRKKIADHEILIIIQAKDHKKKADIKILGEFSSVILDVRAARGILICNAGFTKTAKEYAKNKAIELYTAHDATIKDWQSEIKIPVIRKHTIMTYSLRTPFEITKEVKEALKEKATKIQVKIGAEGIIMKKFDGSETTFLKEFTKAWNDNKIETNSGNYKIIFDAYNDIFGDPDLFPPKPEEFHYVVKTRHYLKFFTPTDYRGIKNYVTEKFKPSFIEIKDAIPFTDDKTWQYIEDPSRLSLNSICLEVDIVDMGNLRFIKTEFKE
jgi:restriction endonuclease